MTKIRLLTISVFALLFINMLMVSWFFLRENSQNTQTKASALPIGPKLIIIDKLEFDKAQVAKYELLIQKHRTTIKGLNNAVSETKKKLYESLKNETLMDQDSLIDKIASLQREIETTHYKHFIEIRGLCKPSQIQKFNDLTQDLANYFISQRKVIKL